MTTAYGRSTLQATALLGSINLNANCMANPQRGVDSSSRPTGSFRSRRPPFPLRDLLITSSRSVTDVSGLKCYPCLRPPRVSPEGAAFLRPEI